MRLIILIVLCLALLAGCQPKTGETSGQASSKTVAQKEAGKDVAKNAVKNIFQDKTLRDIYTLQNRRDTTGLLTCFKDKNPLYRRAAAMAFGSVQDIAAIQPLCALLQDADAGVRSATAFALGQTNDNSDKKEEENKAETALIEAFKKETEPDVKRHILEAIGKCGTAKGLDFLLSLEPKGNEIPILTGQAWGLYRFALKNIIKPEGTARAIALLDNDMLEEIRFIASCYLARARNIDLAPHAGALLKVYEGGDSLFTRLNMISAMGKALKPEILECLKSILSSSAGDDLREIDYRYKVNALRALRGFEYKDTREIILKLAAAGDIHVATAAAELLQGIGKESDTQLYFDTASKLGLWRPRTTLLAAALTHTPAKNKKLRKQIRDFIVAAYKKSINNYEKANLAVALGNGDLEDVQFLENQAFSNKGNVIGSYAIGAVSDLCLAVKKLDKKQMENFTRIFRKAVESGDSTMILIGATTLRSDKVSFKPYVKDAAFLKASLEKCKLPDDIEAWQELKRTIDFFEGTKEADAPAPLKNSAIDWELVASIAPDREVTVKTSKGDIVIRLLVEQSPGSVSNFLKLIRENFYKQSVFHRVVPNFVIQDGCPRGDGSGGPSYSIGSELLGNYEEGSVGMASAGKDTEGSQWFITHQPTPHLDGRYSIFGKVVKGLDIVHKIEVGDKILGFEL